MPREDIMLCYPFEEKRLNQWNSLFIVQPKLDGDRCRAIFAEDGDVLLLSSEGNIFSSVPHIEEELKSLKLSGIELDGELYRHGLAHQDIHGIVSRTVNLHAEHEVIEFHVFDIVNSLPQHERTTLLGKLIPDNLKYIKKVESLIGNSIQDVTRYLDLCIKLGYEGIVLRHAYNLYMRKRSTQLMKFKPTKSDWYRIVSFNEEISIHGEPKDTLGALVLSSDTGDLFQVGSGSFLTAENRRTLWENREKLIGQIAHIKYQHLTKRSVPRFPVLINILPTKEGK